VIFASHCNVCDSSVAGVGSDVVSLIDDDMVKLDSVQCNAFAVCFPTPTRSAMSSLGDLLRLTLGAAPLTPPLLAHEIPPGLQVQACV